MVGLDEFINFIIEHKDDSRISISKKMKYGYRHYYITLSIDEEPKKDVSSTSHPSFHYRFTDSLEVCIDNRNKCIEILYDNGYSNIVVEDDVLVEKWSTKIDELLNHNIEDKLKKVIETTLSSCYNKNLYREYQMRKIFTGK